MAGIAEPSLASLKKIAKYFWTSLAYLRGGPIGPLERFLEGLKIAGIGEEFYNKTLTDKAEKDGDWWGEMIAGNAVFNSETIEFMCSLFGIDSYWVRTGGEPPILSRKGIVGKIIKTSGWEAYPPWMDRKFPLPVSKDTPSASDIHTPYAVCAKCGNELRPDDQGKEYDPSESLRFWPCETCCKK